MYTVIIGEFDEKRKNGWLDPEGNPFTIIQKEYYRGSTTIDFIIKAPKYLHDEIKIDWGSWVWKATKTELKELDKELHLRQLDFSRFDDGIEYGVVYIEQV